MVTMRQAHLDAALSDFAIGIFEDPREHVAGGFFPITEVDQLSNRYHVLPRNPFTRAGGKARGSLQEAPAFEFELSNDNYNCVNFSEAADVDEFKLANADTMARRLMEQGATNVASVNLLLTHEIAWAEALFKAGVWGRDVTGVNGAPGVNQVLRWNDANSDPEKDIDDGKEWVRLNGGLTPNRLLLPLPVFNTLKRHPKVLARFQPTSSKSITPEMLADYLGIDRIVVAKTARATNAVGAAESYDWVHGKKALLAYCGENGSGDMMPSAGRVFAWRGTNPGGTQLGAPGSLSSRIISVERIPMPLKKGIRFEVNMGWDNKVTGQKLGYFFDSIIG